MNKHRFLSLTVITVFCLQSRLCAQEGLLDKPVQLKSKTEKLEKILDQLSREGDFYFSYKSNILDKERMVIISGKECSLREMLSGILGKDYAFLETDNYVVIRKKEFNYRYPQKKVWVDPEPVHKKKRNNGPGYAAKREQRETVLHIIDDLIRGNLIADRDSLVWFGLDNGQFVVNGNIQPDSLLSIFRAKYIKPDGCGYYYGSVKVTGKGYFFDKSDLY